MIIRNISGGTLDLGFINFGVNIANGATLSISEDYVNNTSFQALKNAAKIAIVSFGVTPYTRFTVFGETVGGGTISYDNTLTGLVATTVQDAIDEVVLDSAKLVYDNTISGLAATNVKTAIDEIAGDSAKVAYDNTISGLAATNVKLAIDEIAGDSAKVAYDNTISGLVATNVKTAVDELAGLLPTKSTISTADAVPTTIKQVTGLVAGTLYGVEVHIIGKAAANSAYYIYHLLCSNTAIIVQDLDVLIETSAAWDVTSTIGANTLSIQVTGEALTNIDWVCSTMVQTN